MTTRKPEVVHAKSLTERAARKTREAYVDRRGPGLPIFAHHAEREAADLVELPQPPDVGVGGEVVREQTGVVSRSRFAIRNTLSEGATRVAEDASIRRTDLLLQPNFDAVAMGADAAESIGATNSLEKMLAHQLAVAHEASLRMLNRALEEADGAEACRLTNAAARLMVVYQGALQTLHKLRNGGNQKVTVEHVTVTAGGQAVIGNVQTPGPVNGGGDANGG